MQNPARETAGEDYTRRLQDRGSALWKRVLDVQRPYRWNLRRLRLGRTLDVGCGLGRNLQNLGGGSVGVDHNPTSVAAARARGLEAFTVDDFLKSRFAVPDAFDSLLVAHVLEHLSPAAARELLETYVAYVRQAGTVVLITPQEAGQASDPTHVTYFDLRALDALGAAVGLHRVRSFSFPFPAAVGLVFPYNENVFVGVRGSAQP